MLKALSQIIKNWPANHRHIYGYAPKNPYHEEYYLTNCSDYDLYKHSGGKKLDFVRQMTLSLAPSVKKKKALDAGCGRGELVYALAQAGSTVIGIDFSDSAVKLSRQTCADFIKRQRATIAKMDATDLKFPDNSFDLVFAGDLVEHLSDTDLKKFIKESHRILKSNGQLIIHTLPTVNYKRIGQYLVKWYFKTRVIPWKTLTIAEEAADERIGHINIQSQKSLYNYLTQDFHKNKVRVFYGPANNQGMIKKAVTLLGLWRILSHHLWATARK